MSYATLRRWRERRRRGEPIVRPPGPAKIPGLPIAELREHVASLQHGAKRSRGTGALYRECRDHISRRDLAELVGEERERQKRQRRANLQHLTWAQPNVAWAMDATTLRTGPADPGRIVVLARDLASHYHFEPLVLPAESAAANINWLQSLLRRYPTPLLLKRDNGSPFNGDTLGVLLAERCIITLNSPVRHPRYNGAIEHGIGSFKRDLRGVLDPDRPIPPADRLRPLIRASILLHNTRPRRSLGGLTPAQAYFHQPGYRCTRRERHAIFESISANAVEKLETQQEKNGRHDMASVWRHAVVAWLRRQHLITFSKT